MSTQRRTKSARAGDWLEARSVSGGAPHRGQIVAVIGAPAHRRYRVRWDEAHESIVYPADGVSLIRAKKH
jgi:hypothetical protein